LSIRRFKLNSLFARILISFTILMMILMVTMTFIFSNLYLKTLYIQLSQEQVKGLETLSKNIDNLFKEMDQIYLNMEINNDISFFQASRASDDIVNNKARIQIRNIRQINPYIHSIFVYNSSIDEYINEGESGFDAEAYIRRDATFHRSVNDTRTIYLTRLKKPGASPNFLTNKAIDYVISMEYMNRSLNGEQQTVIINLDEDLFVRDYLSKYGYEVLIADEQGMLLAHTDPRQIGSAVKDDAIFSAVLRATESSGDVSDNDGTLRSLVTFVKNETTGWYILSKTPYDSLVDPIQDKRNRLLTICVFILIACLIVTFLISKRLYNPVEKLIEQFRRSQFNIEDVTSNDLSFIGGIYAETLQHMISLENKNKDSLYLMRGNFLRRILTTEESDVTLLYEEYSEYQLKVDPSCLILCVFKIDGYSLMDGREMTLNESILFQSITEWLSTDYRYESVQMPKGEFVILMNKADDQEKGFEHLLTRLERIKDTISTLHRFTVSIGVSDEISTWGNCSEAYTQALEMLQQRFVLGYNQIIYTEYVEGALVRSYCLPNEIEKKLVSAIKGNDRECFVKALESGSYVLKGYVYTDAVQALFHIFLVCITQMNQMINDENKTLGMQFGELNLIFTEMETLEYAMDWLLKQFDDYSDNLEGIKQLKENKFYRKVEEIMHYIQEHYWDSNLSVEVLAEVAGYTPNYFSKIFKEMTGSNSGEYIRRVRIDNAKDLLKSDVYKVSEVAEMCGYPNSSHFYSAFKKDVGLTPSAYREFALSEREPKQ
jgi:two-component system response regulator YesN